MSGVRIIIDGLWTCLCPSINKATLFRAIGNPHPVSRAQVLRSYSSSVQPSKCRTRSFHATGRRRAEGDQSGFDESASGHVEKGQGEDRSVTVKQLLQGNDLLTRDRVSARLHGAPTPTIYEALRALQGVSGKRDTIRALVRYLVQYRDEKPNTFLYEALMVSNWDVAGSAEEVKDLLTEMRLEGIEGSASFYHAVLRVCLVQEKGALSSKLFNVNSLLQALAVHPDYLQRNTILRAMKERWIDLTPEGESSVVLGLLRDGQHELALNALERLAKNGVAIPPRLYDTFIYVLCQSGFTNEAVKLLRQRLQNNEAQRAIPLSVWYFLLDECSSQLDYEGTKLVWDRMVQPKTLVPADGMCLNILNTASRHGDSKLATLVIQHLSTRGVKLGLQHFEALVDCYSQNNDLENALEVFCIMRNAGIEPDRSSTRSVYLSLKRSPGLAVAAADTLFRLRAKHEIPISAFNAVIEGLCAAGYSDRALDLYHDVRRLCSTCPNLYTFEPLMSNCEDVQTAEFLASEMSAFSVRPSRAMYDQLVYIFTLHGDIEAAFRYMAEMGRAAARGGQRKTAQTWITRRTAIALAKRCFAVKDERVWDLLEAARRRGMDLTQDIPASLVGLMSRPKADNDLQSGVVPKAAAAATQQMSG